MVIHSFTCRKTNFTVTWHIMRCSNIYSSTIYSKCSVLPFTILTINSFSGNLDTFFFLQCEINLMWLQECIWNLICIFSQNIGPRGMSKNLMHEIVWGMYIDSSVKVSTHTHTRLVMVERFGHVSRLGYLIKHYNTEKSKI